MGTVRTPYVTDLMLAQIRACKAKGMGNAAIVTKLEPRFDRISVEHALTFSEFKTEKAEPEAKVEEDLLAPTPAFKKR